MIWHGSAFVYGFMLVVAHVCLTRTSCSLSYLRDELVLSPAVWREILVILCKKNVLLLAYYINI